VKTHGLPPKAPLESRCGSSLERAVYLEFRGLPRALTAAFSSIFVGCMPIGGYGQVSYFAPSVDIPAARYGDPNVATQGISSRVPPREVEFDVGGATVDVQLSASCERERSIVVVFPFPPIPSARGNGTVLQLAVGITGEAVSVDPAQMTLRDSTGKVLPGTLTSPFSGSPFPNEKTRTVYFEVPCESSDAYDLVLGGVSIHDHPVEIPTVHIARGTVRQVIP